jgi:hypothetical protein
MKARGRMDNSDEKALKEPDALDRPTTAGEGDAQLRIS